MNNLALEHPLSQHPLDLEQPQEQELRVMHHPEDLDWGAILERQIHKVSNNITRVLEDNQIRSKVEHVVKTNCLISVV
jgi:hypothetical protein